MSSEERLYKPGHDYDMIHDNVQNLLIASLTSFLPPLWHKIIPAEIPTYFAFRERRKKVKETCILLRKKSWENPSKPRWKK